MQEWELSLWYVPTAKKESMTLPMLRYAVIISLIFHSLTNSISFDWFMDTLMQDDSKLYCIQWFCAYSSDCLRKWCLIYSICISWYCKENVIINSIIDNIISRFFVLNVATFGWFEFVFVHSWSFQLTTNWYTKTETTIIWRDFLWELLGNEKVTRDNSIWNFW